MILAAKSQIHECAGPADPLASRPLLLLSLQLLTHLGDFPYRLPENCRAVYDYTPLPPVGYPELKEEIWCHRYYLRNLIDETRFQGWPVVDHITLVQRLLVEWREELARQPLSMSDVEARRVLQVPPARFGRRKGLCLCTGNADVPCCCLHRLTSETMGP